jgi:hypothetical protein
MLRRIGRLILRLVSVGVLGGLSWVSAVVVWDSLVRLWSGQPIGSLLTRLGRVETGPGFGTSDVIFYLLMILIFGFFWLISTGYGLAALLSWSTFLEMIRITPKDRSEEKP